MSAVSASTPFRAAPSTNRSRNASIASSLRFRLIARRSPSASPIVKPASAIATSSTWSWKTTTPCVSRSGSRSNSWSTGGTYGGSTRSRSRASMYGCTALPWIGPGRTSATCTVRSSIDLGLRPQQALHLRATLDLEVADRVRLLDLRVDRLVVERDPREVDRLAVDLGDLLDAVLDRREHPEAEQVDLEEAGVGARVLVPLADLAAGHRRRLDGDELDERPRGDHHPAGVLRDVARQACDLARQLREGAPARREQPPFGLGQQGELVGDLLRVPAVRDAREPLQLGEREPERLADVADRAARPVGREAGDERRVLAAVALGDADDQLLADVAREVEVDVGHRHQLAVEEAAEREVLRDRVDVREAGQVADDRADRRAAAAPGRQEAARRAAARGSRPRAPAPARAPPSGAGRSRRARARRSA